MADKATGTSETPWSPQRQGDGDRHRPASGKVSGVQKPGSRPESASAPHPQAGWAPWLERTVTPRGSSGPTSLCVSFSSCNSNKNPRPTLVPEPGYKDNQSELLRGLNERQLEKKRHFIASTGLPFLEPICRQAAPPPDLLG